MKARNQQHSFNSELDAKNKLIIYVYEYLVNSKAKAAADKFLETIGYKKEIKINEGPGFLLEWWCVFWDLYCASPERRHILPESSPEARAFQDYMRPTQISPQQHQHQQQHPPSFMQPHFIPGPRYATAPMPPREHMTRMHAPTGHPHYALTPNSYVTVVQSRYPAQNPAIVQQSQQRQQIHQPIHMHPSALEHQQLGPPANMSCLTPVSVPPTPPQQMTSMVMQPGSMGGQQLPQQQQNSMTQSVHCITVPASSPIQQTQLQQQQVHTNSNQPVRSGSQTIVWQSNEVAATSKAPSLSSYGSMNSPIGPASVYTTGLAPSPMVSQLSEAGATTMMRTSKGSNSSTDVKHTPIQQLSGSFGDNSSSQTDDFMLPFDQETVEHCDPAELLKQSIQDDSSKLFEKDQSEFTLTDYDDSQSKWPLIE